jgi:endonuclease/exonuclease/phosphatase (EEP) superfamily protein YafD
VRITSINAFFFNSEHDRMRDFIRSSESDVVVLVEATTRWCEALRPLNSRFPYGHALSASAHQGICVLSRWAIRDVEPVWFDARTLLALAITLCMPKQETRLMAVHATWPIGLRNFQTRNQQLAYLAQLARSTAAPLTMIGDFNTTARSRHFRALLAHGGLRSATDGFGRQATWPAWPLPLGIQIDHCLVSPHWVVRQFRRGARVGSDHRPITVDLSL